MEIGVIVNKNARKNRNDSFVVERIKSILGKSGIVEVTEKLEEIGEIIKKFLSEKVKIIGISGGDGTFHQTLTEIIHRYKDRALPYLIHLKRGTMNTIAKGLEIKRKQEEILKRIKDYIDGKISCAVKIVERTTLRVGEKYGFIFGAGFPSNFLDLYYTGKLRGPFKVLYMIGRAIFSHIIKGYYVERLKRVLRAQIIIDGFSLKEEEFSAVLACTVNSVGLSLKVASFAQDLSGQFQFLSSNVEPVKYLSQVPRFLLGIPPSLKGVYNFPISHLLIKPLEENKYTVDGDIYLLENSLEISAGPTIKTLLI